MRVQIKDLYPNPYRDMDNYPINRDKVEMLKASIKQTGFWDNIVARDKDGKIQIAYGHHRLTALREALPWDTEVDIPIKELPDATMIQIMANENMQEYDTTPKVIDETVKVTKEFLEKHPEFIKTKEPDKYSQLTEKGYKYSKTSFYIKEFLGEGWAETTIYESLTRSEAIKKGEVAAKVFDLPHQTAASNFTRAAKKWKLPVEEQEAVIDEIKKSGNYGYDQVEKKVSEARFKSAPKVDKEKKEREDNALKFVNYCRAVYNKSNDLGMDIDLLIDLVDEFTYLNFEDIEGNRDKLQLLTNLKKLSSKINNLLNIIQNEYNN